MKKAPVGIGIIGTGFARTTQIPGFRDCMGTKVVAIASRNRERAEAVAKEFGIEYVADNWQELVAHSDVDLVSVVTPPSTHMEITTAALDQRKAVLCEKPMALNAAEAATMVEKARAAGVLALIDHELRFLNSRRVMHGMLQTGAVGLVRHCNYVFRSDYRAIADRAWDWWSDETMGGGALGAIGSHVVDSFRWILSTEITKVLGMLSTHIKERRDRASGGMRTVTTDDEAKLLFHLADGPHTREATGAASISVVEQGKYENRLEIYGTKGALMVEETGELWISPTGSGVWRPVQVEQDHMAQGMREGSWSRGFTAFAVAICEAMRAGRTTVKDAATFEDGYQVQLVLDAIRASNESGCWVTVGH
ncbi:MAG TPA: Gfo/Idh/MocA family oxidoreductase [Pyrinomonadaceae bacterium]|jgi:predicted dehydrogenase|nr:Gfo/Idh/MocA family oxidoreductase [Pyrinomonadaceae bacterium]